MKKLFIALMTITLVFIFSNTGAFNIQETPELNLGLETARGEIDLKAFMQEVALTYQENRRKTAHIAKATFEEYGKIDGHYAQYTISSRHAIYKGDKANVAKMALYSFVPEKTNKSWRRSEWLSSSRHFRKDRTDLPMNGWVGLNSHQYFELVGPFSSYSDKYKYDLKDIYWVGNEQVYKIRFNTKPDFDLKGRFTKGYIVVAVNSKRLVAADVSGELLWSSMFQERVFGQMHYEYVYHHEQPFLSSISTQYKKKKVEERTLLQIDLQNFNDFVVDLHSVFDLQLLEKNPVVVADKNLIQKASMGVDFEELRKDLGFKESLWTQYQYSAGKTFWRYSDTDKQIQSKNRENAVLLVEEYKKFFGSL
jgi:phage tail tube protein FII